MKKFKFKYSPLVKTLLIIVALLFAAAVVFNIYDCVRYAGANDSLPIFSVLIAALSVFFFGTTLSVLFYGRYEIKGNFLYCRFGIFRSKTDIAEIFQLTEFKANKKLVMYMKGEKYAVAVINEKYYETFYKALKTVNPAITYTVTSEDPLSE